MKCVDHPKIDAVALLNCETYNSQIAVCSECYKIHKNNMNIIRDSK